LTQATVAETSTEHQLFFYVHTPSISVIDGLGRLLTQAVMQMTTKDGERPWHWPCHSWYAGEMHRTVARRLSAQTQALIAASFLALTGSKFSGGI
jgi:hypothetical protein